MSNTKKLQNLSLPMVQFEYPDSNTNHMKLRQVRVVEMNHIYLTGFELADKSLIVEKFKRFNLNRIAKNGVSLVSYVHIKD